VGAGTDAALAPFPGPADAVRREWKLVESVTGLSMRGSWPSGFCRPDARTTITGVAWPTVMAFRRTAMGILNKHGPCVVFVGEVSGSVWATHRERIERHIEVGLWKSAAGGG